MPILAVPSLCCPHLSSPVLVSSLTSTQHKKYFNKSFSITECDSLIFFTSPKQKTKKKHLPGGEMFFLN